MQRGLLVFFKYLQSCHIKDIINFLCVSSESRIRTQVCKLEGSRFWLHLEKDSLTVGVSDNLIAWKSHQVLPCGQSSKSGWPPVKVAVEGFCFA